MVVGGRVAPLDSGPLAQPTTPQVAAAVGVSDETIRRWARIGLLEKPTQSHRGRRGTVSLWPEGTIERAQWVQAHLEAGQTMTQVKEALAAGGLNFTNEER